MGQTSSASPKKRKDPPSEPQIASKKQHTLFSDLEIASDEDSEEFPANVSSLIKKPVIVKKELVLEAKGTPIDSKGLGSPQFPIEIESDSGSSDDEPDKQSDIEDMYDDVAKGHVDSSDDELRSDKGSLKGKEEESDESTDADDNAVEESDEERDNLNHSPTGTTPEGNQFSTLNPPLPPTLSKSLSTTSSKTVESTPSVPPGLPFKPAPMVVPASPSLQVSSVRDAPQKLTPRSSKSLPFRDLIKPPNPPPKKRPSLVQPQRQSAASPDARKQNHQLSRTTSAARVEEMLHIADQGPGQQRKERRDSSPEGRQATQPITNKGFVPQSPPLSRASPASSTSSSSQISKMCQPVAQSQSQSQIEPPPSAQPTQRSRMSPPPSQSVVPRPSQVLSSASQSLSRKRVPKHTKHEDYWPSDGSVVIIVQGTGFRLHSSTLSMESSYFKDLLSNMDIMAVDFDDDVAPPRLDGRPVYELTNVTMSDFENLLKSFRDGITYRHGLPPFDFIASVLRASQALKFEKSYHFALDTLRDMWPTSLANVTETRIPHAAATVVLARTCNEPSLIKRPFYELLRTAFLGQEKVNDVLDVSSLDEIDEEARYQIISRKDLVTLIRCRELMFSRWFQTVARPPSLLSYPCPLTAEGARIRAPLGGPPQNDMAVDVSPEQAAARDKCQEAHQRFHQHWAKKVRDSGLFEEYTHDAICGLERLSEIDWAQFGFCEGCVSTWRTSWQNTRQKLWSDLDLWFSLD